MTRQFNIDTTPRNWDDALAALTPVTPEALQPKAKPVRTPKTKTPEQLKAAADKARKAEKAKARKAIGARIVDFLSSRARDIALACIILGTFVAVFQGSLSTATLFGFTGLSAIAYAVMPDALMVISASKMRGLHVSPVQRREAKISMYFSLAFSLVSNMIAAAHITMPELFTPGVLAGGSIAWHAMIVLFLWRAVETTTKTRADAPSVRRNAKGRNASAARTPAPKLGK